MKSLDIENRSYQSLIVDDEPGICRLMCMSLEKLGFQTQSASNGEEGLKLFEKGKFDVVVSDLRMPVMHGHALIREIFKIDPEQLVVIVTGVGEEQLLFDLLVNGVQYVILKPFHVDYFNTCVLGIVERQCERFRRIEMSIKDFRNNLSSQIAQTSSALNNQLEVIQEQFKQTIGDLEKQQKSVEQDFLGSIRMIAELLEHVPAGGSSHAKRVDDLSHRIGVEAGFTEKELWDLSLASLLHDLGKFGLPDYLLTRRPETMNDEDLKLWKEHSFLGALVVASVPGLANAAEIVEQHHENYDGSGFPRQLSGANISALGMILRIADGIDRFMERLPEQGSGSWDEVRAHLDAMSGKYYNPELSRIAYRVIDNLQVENEKLKIIEITPSELKAGQKLAENIYHPSLSNDLVLLRRGIVLTPRMAERLKQEFENLELKTKVKIYVE